MKTLHSLGSNASSWRALDRPALSIGRGLEGELSFTGWIRSELHLGRCQVFCISVAVLGNARRPKLKIAWIGLACDCSHLRMRVRDAKQQYKSKAAKVT